MGNSRSPIRINEKTELLPALSREKKAPSVSPFSKAIIIDIPNVDMAPKSARALQNAVHILFPSCSEQELTVKKGRLYLGSKRVGTLSEEKCVRGKMRIWIDDLVKSGAAKEPHVEEEFPKDPKVLSTMLPFSALLGVVFTDARSLLIAITCSKYAALVSEGYDEVRLEFHISKRTAATDSFLLNSHFLESKLPHPGPR